MKLYISNLSLWILIIFYLPLVIWVLSRFIRNSKLHGIKKAVGVCLILISAYVMPLGDVTMHSIAMARVCPNAGLHVYKKVEVDGYYDPSGTEDVLFRYPYDFLEVGRKGTKFLRLDRADNEKIVYTEIEEPMARYEVVYDNKAPTLELGVCSMQRWWVRDRETGETVGEWLGYSPMHGWLDRLLVVRWFGVGLRGCDGKVLSKYTSWRRELLPPKQNVDAKGGQL